ncbi:hypothetical protein GUJ93_ZPchr0001g32036 [Zizania palustris]|uniref:Uncharacterized protein n=1 Tax=Zizania palustris TaxID=103762 RepID=A0A8J5RME3_ZIZPA|nr:hypothetical protein GUJ93_ZPchr0001g32036 [Zizania palustris]
MCAVGPVLGRMSVGVAVYFWQERSRDVWLREPEELTRTRGQVTCGAGVACVLKQCSQRRRAIYKRSSAAEAAQWICQTRCSGAIGLTPGEHAHGVFGHMRSRRPHEQ